MDAPDDANDLRGFHFKQLLGRPLTWIVIAIFVLAAGIAGAIYLGAAIGAGAAVAMLLISLLIVFAIADRHSEAAFFAVYADQRGMALSGRKEVESVTPLLCRGSDRYTEHSFAGPLAEDVDGLLALYTYEETTGSGQDRQTSYYPYTIGLVEVPECATQVPELLCRRKFGLQVFEGLEDAFRKSRQRVELESEALDENYEIFSLKEQDQVWLRRLFSPTFVVWLGEEAPKKFAFELVGGKLCCYVNGHKKSAAELDVIRTATATVARRLREESLETANR
ncbi:MAG TPA: hypothetical protein VFW48_08345 [Solirubrobacterales bacterium]|nr:hypothetical protein [Solirubrobacterales bacterium]